MGFENQISSGDRLFLSNFLKIGAYSKLFACFVATIGVIPMNAHFNMLLWACLDGDSKSGTLMANLILIMAEVVRSDQCTNVAILTNSI